MEAAEIMAMVKTAGQNRSGSGGSSTSFDNLVQCDLGNYDCPVCGNTGRITKVDENGILWSRECECMDMRRTIRNIRKSGLEDMVIRYRFDNYETPDEKRKAIKQNAMDYRDGWFFIFGKPGSGKTHICFAICSRCFEKGEEVEYMVWRDKAPKLKALVNSPEYEPMVKKLKTVDVLYIDDFFKAGMSDADLRLAFEILNGRYNNSMLKTIISSELSAYDIMDYDEALGSRIIERAKGHLIEAPDENWRLK